MNLPNLVFQPDSSNKNALHHFLFTSIEVIATFQYNSRTIVNIVMLHDTTLNPNTSYELGIKTNGFSIVVLALLYIEYCNAETDSVTFSCC